MCPRHPQDSGKRNQATFASTVAVFAQGPIGLCATAGAKLKGATTIIPVDTVAERLTVARAVLTAAPRSEAGIRRQIGHGIRHAYVFRLASVNPVAKEPTTNRLDAVRRACATLFATCLNRPNPQWRWFKRGQKGASLLPCTMFEQIDKTALGTQIGFSSAHWLLGKPQPNDRTGQDVQPWRWDRPIRCHP